MTKQIEYWNIIECYDKDKLIVHLTLERNYEVGTGAFYSKTKLMNDFRVDANTIAEYSGNELLFVYNAQYTEDTVDPNQTRTTSLIHDEIGKNVILILIQSKDSTHEKKRHKKTQKKLSEAGSITK